MLDTHLRPSKDVGTVCAESHKSHETFRAIETNWEQVDT